jgi:hypothetical protein
MIGKSCCLVLIKMPKRLKLSYAAQLQADFYEFWSSNMKTPRERLEQKIRASNFPPQPAPRKLPSFYNSANTLRRKQTLPSHFPFPLDPRLVNGFDDDDEVDYFFDDGDNLLEDHFNSITQIGKSG